MDFVGYVRDEHLFLEARRYNTIVFGFTGIGHRVAWSIDLVARETR